MKAVLAGGLVARADTLGHVIACQAANAIAAMTTMASSRGQRLEREELLAERGVITQPRGRSAELDRALLEHVDPVGQRQREVGVLLGKQDGESLALQPPDLVAQVVD